jgi:hypothetical protein
MKLKLVKDNFYFKGSFSNIYKKPRNSSEATSQIIYGEKFKILSKNKNWIKIKSSYDNYIGYIKNKQYIQNFNPKYKVSVLKAKIYIKPNYVSNSHLPLGSKLSVEKENKFYIKIDKKKWIKKKDIKEINYKEKNFIKFFTKFCNVSYKWGGKTYKGIDCSALLQIFFYYNNLFYPRDTKDQIKYSIKKISNKFKKGDIIFWKGHVAICINSKQLIHAYGPEKRVLIMPIKKSIARILNTAYLKVRKISKIKF